MIFDLIKLRRECGLRGTHKVVWAACLDCGKERWVWLTRGKPVNLRCRSCANSGVQHWQWKGGQTRTDGYIIILKPEHPRANGTGRVKRAILALENKLGRPLLPKMVCHHINGVKDDDRANNLEELTQSEHTALHNKGRGKTNL